jgi:ssDNA-binding Zn-finger/Zn-ribbon topoisomerase 1
MYGKFYGCVRWPDCKGTHGAHQSTGEPLGIPANAETKKARILAHEAFDTLWKNGKMSRKEAYKWMQENLSLTKEEAHISRFDKETCERLILAIQEK